MAKCHRIAIPCPVLPLSFPVVYGKMKIMAAALTPSSKSISIGRRAVFLSLPPLLMHYHCPPVEAEDYEKETQKDKEASYTLEKRVGEAIMLLEKGRELQAQADFIHALNCFTQPVPRYDLAGVVVDVADGVFKLNKDDNDYGDIQDFMAGNPKQVGTLVRYTVVEEHLLTSKASNLSYLLLAFQYHGRCSTLSILTRERGHDMFMPRVPCL